MVNGKSIVITAYGHKKVIDKIAVSIFDDFRQGEENAKIYCSNINKLLLRDDEWVNARLITDNVPIHLHNFLPLHFSEMIPMFADKAIQKIMREITNDTWAKAIKDERDEVKNKIYRNMTKNACKMFIDDMELMGAVSFEDARKAQDDIMAVAKHLLYCGEIVSPFPETVVNVDWKN